MTQSVCNVLKEKLKRILCICEAIKIQQLYRITCKYDTHLKIYLNVGLSTYDNCSLSVCEK